MGPMVCDDDGPLSIVKRSKTLITALPPFGRCSRDHGQSKRRAIRGASPPECFEPRDDLLGDDLDLAHLVLLTKPHLAIVCPLPLLFVLLSIDHALGFRVGGVVGVLLREPVLSAGQQNIDAVSSCYSGQGGRARCHQVASHRFLGFKDQVCA